MDGASDIDRIVNSIDGVVSTSSRMLFSGMLSTAKGAKGVDIRGIDPISESKQTKIDEKLSDYLRIQKSVIRFLWGQS